MTPTATVAKRSTPQFGGWGFRNQLCDYCPGGDIKRIKARVWPAVVEIVWPCGAQRHETIWGCGQHLPEMGVAVDVRPGPVPHYRDPDWAERRHHRGEPPCVWVPTEHWHGEDGQIYWNLDALQAQVVRLATETARVEVFEDARAVAVVHAMGLTAVHCTTTRPAQK
jgi:hypothetical protein